MKSRDQPILIVGAGRSGTNLLAANFEAESEDFTNLFENRYIWTYGQRDRSTDIRSKSEATPKVRSYIRKHFDSISQSRPGYLIDKTPGNALRLPFVSSIYPEAKIINIIRDARGNLISRARQWEIQERSQAGTPRPGSTVAGKFGMVRSRFRHLSTLVRRGNLPMAQIPTMLIDGVPSFLSHFVTGNPTRYAERVPGLSEIVKVQGVDVAASVQWRDVVMTSVTEGRRLGESRYFELKYEDLLSSPCETWSNIMRFLKIDESGEGANNLQRNIIRNREIEWSAPENEGRIKDVEHIIRPTLEFLGYDW